MFIFFSPFAPSENRHGTTRINDTVQKKKKNVCILFFVRSDVFVDEVKILNKKIRNRIVSKHRNDVNIIRLINVPKTVSVAV